MFTPDQVPTDPSKLPQFLVDQLRSLADFLNKPSEFGFFQSLANEPQKPREGMVAKADGTNWNPGNGPGMYVFIGSSWYFLGGGSGAAPSTAGLRFGFASNSQYLGLRSVGGM